MGQSDSAIQPGKILEIRSRLWRVDDYSENIVSVTSIDGEITTQRRFFAPVEKIEAAELPMPQSSIIGNNRNQKLLTDAYKLSMIHGSAPLMSLQRSRAIPESFQMVPVVMSLKMPRVRMLIADDVGLGKTIEAGLIITELLARQKASTVLVICPAAIREQWKNALSYFFHIDAKVISSRQYRSLERELSPGVSPWEHYPFLIASMDYAKQPNIRNQIMENKWDIVLVDEAHNLSKPHQISGSQKVEKARWDLLRILCGKKSEHLLLLTATPHNGYTDTFCSLLRVLDVGAVAGSDHKPVLKREIAKKHICQRRRKDVIKVFKREDGTNPFPERDAKEIYITPSEIERNLYENIERLGNHILYASGLKTAFQQVIAKWTITHLHKRALSSPGALRSSLRNRLKRLKASDSEITLTEEEARSQVLDKDTGERVDDEEASSRMDRLIWGDGNALEKEIKIVKELIADAKKLTPRRDSKLEKLLNYGLPELLERDSKVIIFTRYRDTLKYLEREIPKHPKHKGLKIFTMDGTLNTSARRERLHNFGIARKAVLVATDCISEGMNLQRYAAQLVHYELPWNPNRLEQRNGRVDRYGQKRLSTVSIRTMVVEDSIEAGILTVLVKKANQIREDEGFSPPFFGDNLSVLDLIRDQGIDISIGQTKLDAFCEGLSKEKVDIQPYSKESIETVRSESFYGQTEINLDELHERQQKTYELLGDRDALQHFVKTGLRLFGSTLEKLENSVLNVTITDPHLKIGLPQTTDYKITFDPEAGLENPDLDVIEISHPIVKNLIDLIKEKSYSDPKFYGRTACIKTAEASKISFVYNFLVRFAVNTKPASIIEEMITIGISDGKELTADEIQKLQQSKPLSDSRTDSEMKEDLDSALNHNSLTNIVNQCVEQRLSLLIDERKQDRSQLEEQGAGSAVEGIDDIQEASRDMLSVTVYYPASGGR